VSARVHGIVSITLVLVSTFVATVAAFLTSWVLGLTYLVVCGLGLGGILFAYCAKCPCREQCGHVIPGKVVGALGQRTPGPYTPLELVVVGLALLGLVAVPQAWLWHYPAMFMVFWAMTIIAVVQIRAFVCRACDNVYCPARAGS
jgi:hypothetical protein